MILTVGQVQTFQINDLGYFKPSGIVDLYLQTYKCILNKNTVDGTLTLLIGFNASGPNFFLKKNQDNAIASLLQKYKFKQLEISIKLTVRHSFPQKLFMFPAHALNTLSSLTTKRRPLKQIKQVISYYSGVASILLSGMPSNISFCCNISPFKLAL